MPRQPDPHDTPTDWSAIADALEARRDQVLPEHRWIYEREAEAARARAAALELREAA